MSFGKDVRRRLLSPFAALLWVSVTVGFAGVAHADTSSGHAAQAAHATGGPDKSSTISTTGTSTPRSAAPDRAKPSHAGSVSKTTHGGTSGDVNSPQPISKADANAGGANGQCPGGPYCSTRDGSASANGNGGGKAVGKPCAGCVGKADNKNPQGQKPDASDHNAGYECDTNHGIAKTNPAHTGCLTPPLQECVPTPEVPCVSPPECVPTPAVPCVPQVSPLLNPPAPAPPRTPPHLPDTGAPADTAWLVSVALAGILAGSGMLLGRRLRREPA
jgi:LPXTG-motif cell wall-anchored protein